MPPFRCNICLETIDDAANPMATLCGHIYCLDCATFHFYKSDPSCAVCRAPQSPDQLIRLYPNWESEYTDTRQNATTNAHEEHSASSSPVSVRYIDRAAADTVSSLKYAIANRQTPREALLVCNTFVNSVPTRAESSINSELLQEISFQLNLLDTKMNDDASGRLDRLKQNAQSARANETRLNLQVEQQRSVIDRLEKDKARFASQYEMLAQFNTTLQQQCTVHGEEARRQCVRADKAEDTRQRLEQEKNDWMQKATKLMKKYHALKNKIEETKRAASHIIRGNAHDASNDLVVI